MYLGIDIGTTSVKTVLVDKEQRVMASASQALAVSRPQPGWSEQDAEDWWAAVEGTLDAIHASHPGDLAAVEAIGLSGQMHGATLLDGEGAVLRPAILWNDGRAAAECAELEVACPTSRSITGNIAMPGFTAPKLLWVRRHEPALFERVRKVLLPKDYIRWRLTGEFGSDMSDASGTAWLDVGARAWSDAMLAATGLTRDQMPTLFEGTAPTGQLRPDLRTRWGMARAPVVAGGAGDNAASACGIGAVVPGSAFVSLGTSGVLFVSNARFSPNTEGAVHAFCHALPGIWHQMGVILSATDSLNWLARLLREPAPVLADEVALGFDGPAPVTFLPYLSGERTPHNNAAARGVFTGLAQVSDRRVMTQAVLEGVAFAFKDCQRVLADAGSDFARAFAVGGGAQSAIWLTILASVLDRPLDLCAESEVGAAFGAARLAMASHLGGDPARLMPPPPVERTIEPRNDLVPRYRAAYERYRTLYPLARVA